MINIYQNSTRLSSTLFIHEDPRFQYHHGESSQLESRDRFRDDVFGRSLGRIPVCRGVYDAKVVITGPYVNSGRSKRDSEVAFRGIWDSYSGYQVSLIMLTGGRETKLQTKYPLS